MADRNSPIGVFDSGVGGLTVAREIMRQMPEERIVYFGDTARVPYGNKSGNTVIRFTRQIIRFLLTQDVKAMLSRATLRRPMRWRRWRENWIFPSSV